MSQARLVRAPNCIQILPILKQKTPLQHPNVPVSIPITLSRGRTARPPFTLASERSERSSSSEMRSELPCNAERLRKTVHSGSAWQMALQSAWALQ